MKQAPLLFGILIVLSCPRPADYTIMPVPDAELIQEAQTVSQTKPLYAHDLLTRVKDKAQLSNKYRALIRLYSSQREYARAAALFDSCGPNPGIPDYEINLSLSRSGQWAALAERTTNPLLKALAFYRAGNFDNCRTIIAQDTDFTALRTLYRARAFNKLGLSDSALAVLAGIDSIPRYLQGDYRDLLLDLLPRSRDIALFKKQLELLRDASLKDYALLKYYERHGNQKNLAAAAWKLIREYPASAGALYALALVRPKNEAEHRARGVAYYQHGRYRQAADELEKTTLDPLSRFYLGRSFYELKNYSRALSCLNPLASAEALYYQGRSYENIESYALAVALYDSLCRRYPDSKLAVSALRQKAFLLEDLGDTLKAVETFLKINERNTRFRAALQLYRLGRLPEALNILAGSSDPEYLYWQIRVRERLDLPIDSLKAFLFRRYPLSYYSLLKNRTRLPIDTLTFDRWLAQFGDTAITFDRQDSLRLYRATAYFEIGETNYGVAELTGLEPLSLGDLRYLNELCDRYGADRPAINYALAIKERAEQKNIFTMPLELFQRIYPRRYLFTIKETGLDQNLILALIWQESLFDPAAVSTADARGLMQIIPETGRILAQGLNVENYSLFDPVTCIRFGSHYLNDLMRQFDSPILALAAYNAGPVNVRRWLKKNPHAETDEFVELIPYRETRDYLKFILARQIIYQNLLTAAAD